MGEFSSGVEVLWLAENDYHVGARLREHAHEEYYQVYCVLEGGGTFLVNHEPVEFDVGTVFFLAPGVFHGIQEIRTGGRDAARLLEAKFTIQDSGLLEETAKLPAVCRGTDGLNALLYQVFLEGVQKDVYYENLVSCLFAAWLYQLIRLYKNYNPTSGKDGLQPRPTVHVKNYLDEHFAEDVSLDMLAEATGYSKNYLCRIFRESTGMTINHYLNEVRVSKAIDLLACTDLDLTEIARRCGYNSVYYFIKTFKKRMGVPPGSYRKSELTGVDLAEGQVESVNSAMRASDVLLLRLNQKKA